MKVGSLFSGIGGLDLGLERAGMEVVWQVEIDPFRQRLLERHWPDVERFEDVRAVAIRRDAGDKRREPQQPEGWRPLAPAGKGGAPALSRVDLICGGFPCQDLSIAGRRLGLQGARSGLFFEFARILGEVRPRWCLIENVPGLLSSNGGDDFRVVIDALQGLGYGVSWRILNSQHFGVPQRRRRVYVVGSLGDLHSAAVLFEPEGSGGHPAPGSKEREGVAGSLGGGSGKRGWCSDVERATFIPESSRPIKASGGLPGKGEDHETYIASPPTDPDGVREATGVPRRVDARPQAYTIHAAESCAQERHAFESDTARGLDSTGGFATNQGGTLIAGTVTGAEAHNGNSNPIPDNLVATPLRGRSSAAGVSTPGRGGEDDWNLIAGAKAAASEAKPCCPDGARYAALGDAVTVSVAEWIGRRIMMAEAS